jgi:energy-coupling factor transporter transmembrane protein EcfT
MPQQSSQIAEVEAISPEFSGRILTSFSIFFDNWFLTLILLGGFVLILLGGYLLFDLDEISKQTKIIGISSLLFGLFLWAVFFFFDRINPSFFSNSRLRRRARRELKCRLDKIVNPEDVDSRFVEIVPRARWAKPMLRNAVDVGFLKVDQQNGFLFFEGDNERYRIPAQAIIKCEQAYSSGFDSSTRNYYGRTVTTYIEHRYFFTALAVKLENQTFEIAFRILAGKGLFNLEQQGSASLELLKEIHQMQKSFTSD